MRKAPAVWWQQMGSWSRLQQEAELCPLTVEGGTGRAIKIDLLPGSKEESTFPNTRPAMKRGGGETKTFS